MRTVNFRFGVHLAVLLAATWLVGAGSMGFLLSRLFSILQTYDELFSGQVRQKEASRETQLAFNKQVREWKNILLRGESETDRRRSTARFMELEAQTAQLALKLRRPAAVEIRPSIDRFIALHQALGIDYREALRLFGKGHFRNAREIDRMLRGQDREPADLMDDIVTKLSDQVLRERTNISRSLHVFEIGFGVAFLFVLGLS